MVAESKEGKLFIESDRTRPKRPWNVYVTPWQEILNGKYKGKGTKAEPFLIDFLPNDPENPLNWPASYRWFLTGIVSLATLAVTFCSSAYSGGAKDIITHLEATVLGFTLGVSLFVLGFAFGPLIWAPLSELYGRRYLYLGTIAALTAFNAGAAGSQNIHTLLILRFFAGAFGSSPLTNAGGTIADTFTAKQRGLATCLFAAAPFMGPVLGPLVGGFTGQTIGWRWIEGLMAIFTGVVFFVIFFFLPETYAPVLLRKRAEKLSKETGKDYLTIFQAKGVVKTSTLFKTSLSRPWGLLFKEPIVLLMSIYMAIVYGTLYLLFAAFPIVYQQNRGWSPGIGGLAFSGVAVGMVFAVTYNIMENKRYIRAADSNGGRAPPEERLPPAILGGVLLPIGLFWFAWTNYPSIHWIASIAAGIPFGMGMVLVFLSILNYLIDTYVIYAASVLAANSVLRSLFGFAFPLFTKDMYATLGIHWASTLVAFLSLACLPFPIIFWKFGKRIRNSSKTAVEAENFIINLMEQKKAIQMQETHSTSSVESDSPHLKEEAGGIDEENLQSSTVHIPDPEENKGENNV
eukprot:TRINITY_DN5818_c0_g1_i1.p1 TRINITY_DN5818_c0_g1~~TRINITY_DN5818_c0_g1_i1.p1  ORF type:complete len:573 (-),score=181.21 TRINITY_DN5818_c0_g1_i1:43-1761(-)